MQPQPVLRQLRARHPCVVVEQQAAADPSVEVRGDRERAATLSMLGSVTRGVAAVLADRERPADIAVDLPGVLEQVATTASRVLATVVVHVAPDDENLSAAVTPAVCVPVVDGEGTAGGHLHLLSADGAAATATDRTTLEFLAGYAVDLSAILVRERELQGALVRAGLEIDAVRDEAEHLTRALASNRQIGVAIGVLVALHQVTPERAFDLLRDASQNANRKLHEIAADVVLTGALPSSTSQRAAAEPRTRTRVAGTPVAGTPVAGTPVADTPVAGTPVAGTPVAAVDRVDTTGRRYHLDLTLRRDRADLRLRGALDLAARDDLTAVLRRLDDLPLPVHCDAHGVTFADADGVEPLVTAARRRRRHDQPPVVVLRASPAVERALGLLGALDLVRER